MPTGHRAGLLPGCLRGAALVAVFPALFAANSLLAPGVGAQEIRGVVLEAPDPRLAPPVPERDVAQEDLVPQPVADAEVQLLRGGEPVGRLVLSDSVGLFLLPVPGPGTYAIRVRHPAYLAYDSEEFQVGNDESVALEVHLGRNVIPLEPLVVTARIRAMMAGFNDRRTGGGFGTFITQEEIDNRRAGRTTDLLRGIPGVNIKFERWGVGSTIEMRNGFGICEPAIFLDGVRVPQVQGSMVDDFLTPERIAGVEVYSSFSMAPVQYISGHCGVILFWTRSGGREGGKPWHWKKMLLGFGAAAVAILLWVR